MAEKMIHLAVTPQQARGIMACIELARQMFQVPENTPVYPNLGDFKMERELLKAEVGSVKAALMPQLEAQMPKE